LYHGPVRRGCILLVSTSSVQVLDVSELAIDRRFFATDGIG